MNNDLELLSARFLSCELPKEKEYLRKYFPGDIQERFAIYWLIFPYDGQFRRFYNNFVAHTGIYCTERYVFKLLNKIEALELRMTQAEKEKDHETVALIRSGKFGPKKGRPKKTIT